MLQTWATSKQNCAAEYDKLDKANMDGKRQWIHLQRNVDAIL